MVERHRRARVIPAKSKSNYHHGNLRPALLAAAWKIAEKEGAQGLSLRSAARLAGVSHAAPYAHFEDKEDLIAAMKDEGFNELLAKLQAAQIKAPKQAADRLRQFGRVYIDFAMSNPAKYEIMMRRPLQRAAKSQTFIETGRAAFGILAKEVSDLLKERKAKPRFSAELLVMCAWSSLHGLCALWSGGPLEVVAGKELRLDRLSEQFLDFLVATITQE